MRSKIPAIATLGLLLVLFFTSGCSVYRESFVTENVYLPPSTSSARVKQKLRASFDQVWETSIEYLQKEAFTVELTDKYAGTIFAKKYFPTAADAGDWINAGAVRVADIRVREYLKPDPTKPKQTKEDIKKHGIITRTERKKMKERIEPAEYPLEMTVDITVYLGIGGVEVEVESRASARDEVHGTLPQPQSTGEFEKDYFDYLEKTLFPEAWEEKQKKRR